MSLPLVSVVIPTCGRPQFLPVAVRSALESTGNDVEVIVVPNGPDESWRQSLASFADDPRVHIEPTSTANANAARNHGMSLAHGKYLRFLDDDDYLLPAGLAQLELLECTGAEMCSGLLRNLDQTGADLGTLTFPLTRDFVCAAVSISGFTLPTSNVFRRISLGDCRWAHNFRRVQDYAWMIHLATRREWQWVHLDQHVGVWFQHDQRRTSTVRVAKERENLIIDLLLSLHQRLRADERLTPERSNAIAAALWHYAHRRFPFHPLHWSQVATKALEISPNSRPAHPIFETGILRKLNPLLVEWAMLPARKVTTLYREIKHSIVGWDYRRRL